MYVSGGKVLARPPTGGDPPPTGGDPPPTGGDPPPTGGDPPPTGGDPPPTGGDPPVGSLNLLADTNVDGLFDAADDALEDDLLGKIVFVNDDDDDGNLEVDGGQAGLIPGEDELAEVRIEWAVPDPGFALKGYGLRLELAGDVGLVQMWTSPERSQVVPSFVEYWGPRETPPPVLYLEAHGVGVVTLTATLIGPGGQVACQPGGAPARDVIRARLGHFNLDVNNDQDTADPEDGFWDYRPGYVGTTAVLSTGSFRDLTPLAPQRMNGVLNGLGSDMGVRRVDASLASVSDLKGYTGNASDPGDTWYNDRDDVSFSPDEDKTRTNTDDDGAVERTKSYLRVTVRDYAATANFNVWVRDGSNTVRGNTWRQMVRDIDGDSLQDGWETDEVARFKTQYGIQFVGNPGATSIFGTGEPMATANEYVDPDGGDHTH